MRGRKRKERDGKNIMKDKIFCYNICTCTCVRTQCIYMYTHNYVYYIMYMCMCHLYMHIQYIALEFTDWGGREGGN